MSKDEKLRKFNSLPWIEKYRPKKIEHMLLHPYVYKKIQEIIKRKQLYNLIITGRPGIGKTTTFRCLGTKLYGKYSKEYVLEFVKDGRYKINIPNILESSEYELIVIHDNYQFSSVEKLTKSSLIDNVVQGDRNSLSGDAIEIITTFTDLDQMDNYFLFEFGDKGNLQPARDLYINGNSFSFSYFIEKTEIPNSKKLKVKMEGIDYNYFKYMIQVVIQTNTQNGPFSTPPAPIKGNILNIKDSNSVVFGYFKVCEFDEFILENIIID